MLSLLSRPKLTFAHTLTNIIALSTTTTLVAMSAHSLNQSHTHYFKTSSSQDDIAHSLIKQTAPNFQIRDITHTDASEYSIYSGNHSGQNHTELSHSELSHTDTRTFDEALLRWKKILTAPNLNDEQKTLAMAELENNLPPSVAQMIRYKSAERTLHIKLNQLQGSEKYAQARYHLLSDFYGEQIAYRIQGISPSL